MIEGLGKSRTQFRAAVAVSCGNQLSYKIEKHELQNEFNEIATTMKDKKRDVASLVRGSGHGLKLEAEEFGGALSPLAVKALAKSSKNFFSSF